MDKKQWDNVCSQVNTCALTGATAFFAGIPDAVMVANGPLWCYFYALRQLEKPCASITNRFYCSQPDSTAVVYGTEECLLEILAAIPKSPPPSVLLIENSCAISLIGDDIAGIASQVDLPCPVVCMDSGGLIGGFWEGYQGAAKAYFDAMPLAPRGMVKPRTVNLLGCTVGYYNADNDLQELKRMLTLAGYQVLACPGAGSTVEEIANMTAAELNIVIHEELGSELAQRLQQEYGMPYLSLLPPYGIEGSLQWLRAIGKRMWMSVDSLRAIEEEASTLEKKIRRDTVEMQRIWGELWFKDTVVAASSSVALGLAQALRCEWLDTDSLTVVLHDGIRDDSLLEYIDHVVDGSDSGEIEKNLGLLRGGLLLGSSNEKAILQKQSISPVVCQNIALPVCDEVILSDRPTMGLRGACQMLEGLWNQYISMCQRRS